MNIQTIRGRGRRNRGRARRGGRRRAVSDSRIEDVTMGWTKSHVNNAALVYEKELVDRLFTDKALLYYRAAVNRLQMVCRMRGLHYTRSGFITLMTGNTLTKVLEWMNGKVRLADDRTSFCERNT